MSETPSISLVTSATVLQQWVPQPRQIGGADKIGLYCSADSDFLAIGGNRITASDSAQNSDKVGIANMPAPKVVNDVTKTVRSFVMSLFTPINLQQRAKTDPRF